MRPRPISRPSGSRQATAAAHEFAFHAGDADRQQALALAQRPGGPRVDVQSAGEFEVVGEPLLARREPVALGVEERSQRFAMCEAHDHLGLAPGGDDGVRSALGGAGGGADLGDHAALGDARAGPAGHGGVTRVFGVALGHELGLGMEARVGGVEPLLVGEDEEGVGIDEVGHQRAERVVVAELDLVGDDGVVLVDDGYHAQIEQGLEGAAGVEIARAIGQIGVGEEDLGRVPPVGAESVLVGVDECGLADGGGRLQQGRLFGALCPAQALHAGGDRPRGDEADAPPFLEEAGDLLCPAADRLVIQAAAVGGDERAADLDHEEPGGGERCAAVRMRHARSRRGRPRRLPDPAARALRLSSPRALPALRRRAPGSLRRWRH